MILTKPLGTQPAAFMRDWSKVPCKWERAAPYLTLEQLDRAFKVACASMARLNLNGKCRPTLLVSLLLRFCARLLRILRIVFLGDAPVESFFSHPKFRMFFFVFLCLIVYMYSQSHAVICVVYESQSNAICVCDMAIFSQPKSIFISMDM